MKTAPTPSTGASERRLLDATSLLALGIEHWALCIARVSRASTASAQVAQRRSSRFSSIRKGGVVNDPAVLRLIETHVGDLLSVRSVRETIAHLMSLGRYEDVQVFSEPVDRRRAREIRADPAASDRSRRRSPARPYFPRTIFAAWSWSGSAARPAPPAGRSRRGRASGVSAPRLPAGARDRRGWTSSTTRIARRSCSMSFPGTRAKILEVKVTQVDATERSTITEVPDIKVGQIYDEVRDRARAAGVGEPHAERAGTTRPAPSRTRASPAMGRCSCS